MITEDQINIIVFKAEYHYAMLVESARLSMISGGCDLHTCEVNYIGNILEAMYVQLGHGDYTSDTTIYFYNKLLDFISTYSDEYPASDPNYQYPNETVIIIDNGFNTEDFVKKAGNPQTISSPITFTNPVVVPNAVINNQAINLGQATSLIAAANYQTVQVNSASVPQRQRLNFSNQFLYGDDAANFRTNISIGSLAFNLLTGLPNTLAGYGIGDAYTKTQSDARYSPILSGPGYVKIIGGSLTYVTAIPNSDLANSSVTINGTPVSLGGSITLSTGTVTSVSGVAANGFTWSIDNPTTTPAITLLLQNASASQNGQLTSTDWNTFNGKQAAGNYLTALTGDGSASGPGIAALTLATVNGNVGNFGSASNVSSFTVNAKGLITAASNTSIQIAESQVTNLVSDLAAKQGTITLTTSGTSGAATFSGGTLNIPQYSGAVYTAGASMSLSGGAFTIDHAYANTFTVAQNIQVDNLAVTPLPALTLINTTASTSGVQAQFSPSLVLSGTKWNGSASQKVEVRQQSLNGSGGFYYSFDYRLGGTGSWTGMIGIGDGLLSATLLQSSQVQSVLWNGNNWRGQSNNVGNTIAGVGNNSSPWSIAGIGLDIGSGAGANTSGLFNAVAIRQVYNQASGTGSTLDLLINRTETALGSGTHKFLSLQVAGSEKSYIDNAGNFYTIGKSTVNKDNLQSTTINGFELVNNTLTTTPLPYQYSPALYFSGYQGGASPQKVEVRQYSVSGNGNEVFNVDVRVGGTGSYTKSFAILNNGDISTARQILSSTAIQGLTLKATSSVITSSLVNQVNNSGIDIGNFGNFSAASTAVKINPSQNLQPITNSSGLFNTVSIVTPYTQTGTASSLDLLINRVENSLGSGTHFFEKFQVGGVDKYGVDHNGLLYFSGTAGAANQIPIVNAGGTTMTWINSSALAPTNYITTNTTQTGLTGDKTSSGNWNISGVLNVSNMFTTSFNSGAGITFTPYNSTSGRLVITNNASNGGGETNFYAGIGSAGTTGGYNFAGFDNSGSVFQFLNINGITGAATFNGTIVPQVSNTYNNGSSALLWNSIYSYNTTTNIINPVTPIGAPLTLNNSNLSGTGSLVGILANSGTISNSASSYLGLVLQSNYSTTGTASSIDLYINRIETSFGGGDHQFISLISSGVQRFSIDNYGSITGQVPTLAIVSNIDGTAIQTATLYTVPTGKTLVVTGVEVVVTTATVATLGAMADIYTAVAGDIFSTSANSFTVNTVFSYPVGGVSKVVTAGNSVYYHTTVGGTATTLTYKVILRGYLY